MDEVMERRMTIKYVVQRKIFCDMSQEVLDISTAVVLEDPSGVKVYGAMTGTEWDKWKDTFASKVKDFRVQTWNNSIEYKGGEPV